jgi:hypothetical protein
MINRIANGLVDLAVDLVMLSFGLQVAYCVYRVVLNVIS